MEVAPWPRTEGGITDTTRSHSEIIDDYRRWGKIEWAITISLSTIVSPTYRSNDKRLLTTRSLRNDNWIFLPANPPFRDTKGIKGGRFHSVCKTSIPIGN